MLFCYFCNINNLKSKQQTETYEIYETLPHGIYGYHHLAHGMGRQW